MAKEYLEFTNDQAMERWEERAGRALAAQLGKPWPMPPDSYSAGCVESRKPKYFQRYAARALRHEDPDGSVVTPGGVVQITALVAGIPEADVVMSHGPTERYKKPATKLRGQLSAEAIKTLDGTRERQS